MFAGRLHGLAPRGYSQTPPLGARNLNGFPSFPESLIPRANSAPRRPPRTLARRTPAATGRLRPDATDGRRAPRQALRPDATDGRSAAADVGRYGARRLRFGRGSRRPRGADATRAARPGAARGGTAKGREVVRRRIAHARMGRRPVGNRSHMRRRAGRRPLRQAPAAAGRLRPDATSRPPLPGW